MRKGTESRTEITAGGAGANRSSRLVGTALCLALAVCLGPLAGPAFAIDDDPQYPDEPTTTTTPKENPRHKAVVSGYLHLNDEELLTDEYWTWSFDTTTYFGTSTRPAETRLVKSTCVGGEIYGKLEIKFIDTGPNTAEIWLDARLYEGASCSTTDLDGQKVIGPIKLSAGESKTSDFIVYNSAEHGFDAACEEWYVYCDTDFIDLNLTLKLVY